MFDFLKTFLPFLGKGRQPTFAKIFPLFLASRTARGLRPWTLCHYRNFGRRIPRILGDRSPGDLTRADYLELENREKDFMEHLRRMTRWAHAEGIIPANPIPQRPEPPLVDAQPPAFLTPAEAQRYYDAAEEGFKPALALAMYAGLRPMEVCRIDWKSIHVNERRIRIESEVTKVRRGRIIENVPTILWAQLAVFAGSKKSGPVLAGGTDLTRYNHWVRLRLATARKALVELKPNVFRHSFATYYTALTGNPALTARVLGHRKLDMLARHYDGLATQADAEDYFHPKPVLALPFRCST